MESRPHQPHGIGNKLGKRRYGLGLIREKLAVTQGSAIALNVLVMNLEKLLELLFVLFPSGCSFSWAMEHPAVLNGCS